MLLFTKQSLLLLQTLLLLLHLLPIIFPESLYFATHSLIYYLFCFYKVGLKTH